MGQVSCNLLNAGRRRSCRRLRRRCARQDAIADVGTALAGKRLSDRGLRAGHGFIQRAFQLGFVAQVENRLAAGIARQA